MEKNGDIERMRAQIDEIDAAILQLLAKRKEAALGVARIKQGIGSQGDEERMKEILEKVQKKARELGLKEEDIKALWKGMLAYMIKEQMEKYPY